MKNKTFVAVVAGLACISVSACSSLPEMTRFLPVGATDPVQPMDESTVADSSWTYPFTAEIIWVGFDFCPPGWLPLDGRDLNIADYGALYSLVGTAYGGDGISTFGIPDMRGRAAFGADSDQYPRGYHGEASASLGPEHMPLHRHAVMASSEGPTSPSASNSSFANFGNAEAYAGDLRPDVPMGAQTVSATGQSDPFPIEHPGLVMTACISTSGYYPQRPTRNDDPPEAIDRDMGDIFMTAASFCPNIMLPADGEPILAGGGTLPAILYALIGYTYGGSNYVFDVPDLSGRSPVGYNWSETNGLPVSQLGQQYGSYETALTAETLPAHAHGLYASPNAPTSGDPNGRYFGSFASGYFYNQSPDPSLVPMFSTITSETGQQSPASFNNLAPVTALNTCLTYYASFPIRASED